MQVETAVTLSTSLRYLKGVGPERHKVLGRLGLSTLEDLLYFFPRRYENRGPLKAIRDLVPGEKECLQAAVLSKNLIRTRHGQTIFRVTVSDAGGPLSAVWFNMPYLSKVFEPKARVLLYGRVEVEGSRPKMTHPEYEILPPDGPCESIHGGRIVPVYPLTEDLSQKGIRQLVFHARDKHLNLLRDYLPATLRRRLTLTDLAGAVRQIHFPDSEAAREAAYRRLVFDEFFMLQLAVQMKKAGLRLRDKGVSHAGAESSVDRLLASLDFKLTAGQSAAVRDVLADMKKDRPMSRLVQGDVGSGKTVVAAAALAFTASNGFQGALMAPTEVLAQQLFFNMTRFLEPLGIRTGYLAQNLPPAERQAVLNGVASGSVQVLVGTHALIQTGVRFKRLALAVIDEQHKFGLFQRALLKEKRAGSDTVPHLLLMTATPIPRTLAMTLYGDLDISTVAEMPAGRTPAKTFWVGEEKRAEIYGLLDSLLAQGRQGYAICPLVDDSGKKISAKSAQRAFDELTARFPGRKVGLLHGRMKAAEKKKIMQDFKEKRIELLVSTVVVEVGVDVPNATMMIIENAERFGLAQLHQLRGRVGRGLEESLCVLFSDALSEDSAERLAAFASTTSGFDIAEKDLELRGGGDVVGDRQHGLPALRIGDLSRDIGLLSAARAEAVRIVEKDPALQAPENRPYRQAMKARFPVPDDKLAVLA